MESQLNIRLPNEIVTTKDIPPKQNMMGVENADTQSKGSVA